MYQIRTDRVFSAAHALRLPDGTLEPLHGHDWQVSVTVAADRLDAMQCVMDFHELERIVDAVLDPWRNAHLNDCRPFREGELNPSAERVAETIAHQVADELPEQVALVRVEVGEAPGCTAIYVGQP
jgi:6-pyruvoyltetrahydropterin/6-carboxytetrahydropterin synthase